MMYLPKFLTTVSLTLLFSITSSQIVKGAEIRTTEYQGHDLIPLYLDWDSSRGDNLTHSVLGCFQDGRIEPGLVDWCYERGSYRRVRTEGCVILWTRNTNVKLIPLRRYWHHQRKDFVTVANEQSIQEQTATRGYIYKSLEGYVFAHQVPGTIPLWLYWSARRTDNATGATQDFHRDQRNTPGMAAVRVEGYIYPAHRCR
jgi:hypothetical protein